MNKSFQRSPHQQQRGIGLVEVMVGLLIGMIAVVVMMQLFAGSEGQKRATTGGADAQTVGAVALYTLQRDLQQSGYGTSALPVLGCSLTLRAGVTLSSLAPVAINPADIPAGDAGSDTVLVTYGNTNGAPEGDRIQAQPGTSTYSVETAAAFAVQDLVVAAASPRPTPCALTLTRVTASAAPTVTVAAGVAGVTGGQLFNFGTQFSAVAYAVRNGNLTRCDFMVNDCRAAGSVADPNVWVVVGNNIPALRVQYGHDQTPSIDGAADYFDNATPTVRCGWARVLSVRVALVASNSQFERDPVTETPPEWASSEASERNDASPFDLTLVPNWQNYRYRVFETTTPLRNAAWLSANPEVRTTCTAWPAVAA